MLLCVMAFFCALGCDMEPPNLFEHTVASWYGKDFHGRLTACGETYDMHEMSCAHKTLPMGTILRVYCEGRSVDVIVNDRGPYVEGRGLDLSVAAFKTVARGLNRGLINVTYQQLGREIRPTMRYNL